MERKASICFLFFLAAAFHSSQGFPCDDEFSCDKTCLYGLDYDMMGCPVCRCINPCRGKVCMEGQVCDVEIVQCVTHPCPPNPICRDNVCGGTGALPLKDSNFRDIPCSGTDGLSCPVGFTCSEPARVCCPINKCYQPVDTGSCPLPGMFQNTVEFFYYNFEADRCLPFVFSGCSTTLNLFNGKRPCEEECKDFVKAECVITRDSGTTDDDLEGIITFTQSQAGIFVDVHLTGFNATDNNKLHGFHVHAVGDTGNGCRNAGGHFNPRGVNHGSRGGDWQTRHAGDFGNLEENADGKVYVTFYDTIAQMSGPDSIIGKAIVIHGGEDDLGLVDNDGSRANGNAGPRLGCCIIQET